NIIAVVIGLIALVTGRFRISRYYGLAGTGARVAGFLILAQGVILPPLTAQAVKLLYSHGIDILQHTTILEVLIVWIALNCVLIWAMIPILVKHYGNPYAKDEDAGAPSMTPQPEPPKIIKKLITHCRMCRIPIPPEQQENASTCPSCGADLARAR